MGAAARILALRRSQEELESELDAILSELTTGKTVTSWSVGDSSAEKQAWLLNPPETRAALVAEALSIVNPTDYPPDTVQKTTQTRPVFS